MTSALSNLTLTNCFVFVDDPDRALGFYRDALGLTVKDDVSNGDYRWLTLTTPTQPELEITLQHPEGMPVSDQDKRAITELMTKGVLGGLNLSVDDVDAAFEQVKAAGGEVLQEPADQFYGVRDCAFRDPSGNMIRLKTPKES